MTLFAYCRASTADLAATCPACFRDSTGAGRVLSCDHCGAVIEDTRPNGIERQRREIRAYAAQERAGTRTGPVAWEHAETPGDVLQRILGVMGADDVLLVASVSRLWATPEDFGRRNISATVYAIRERVTVTSETGAGEWWKPTPTWRNFAKPDDGCEWCCSVCEASGTVTWLPRAGRNCHRCQTPKGWCAVSRPHAGMREKMARMAALRSGGETPVRIAAILDMERIRDNWGRKFGRASVEAWLAAWGRINRSGK